MRRRKKKRGFFIAGLVVCILVIYGGIELWQGLFGKSVEADSADKWDEWDLSTMVDPTLTDSTEKFKNKITVARATFYDIYSDSQVWSTTESDYRSSITAAASGATATPGTTAAPSATMYPITDGSKAAAEAGGNTFTHFNYELSHSKNKIEKKNEKGEIEEVEYQHMYDKDASSKVYPLYCGLAWPGQSEASRWGTWSKTSGVYNGYTHNGVTHGWWFAAANTNQFDNGNEKISDEGTPGGTQGGATQGLVNRKLDDNGNITIGHGDAMRVLPYFDSEYLETPYREGKVAKGHVVSNIAFPFRKGDGTTRQYMSESDKTNQTKTSDKYYYFDSYLDTIQLNEAQKNVTYYHGEENNNVKDTDGKNGFFPFNKKSDSMGSSLNYVFGVKMELTFNMTSNGKIKGDDIIFEFTGDDDLWVFVDGYLVLDIGGAHIPCHGSINFASKKAVVDKVKKSDAFNDAYRDGEYGTWESKTYYFGKNNATDANGETLAELLSDTTRNHTLTIFYMERGKGNSNLKIKFNLPQISTLSVGDEVDAGNVNKSLQTEELWKACNQHYFKYILENKGTASTDYNNSITKEKTPGSRTSFQPVGLTSTYRKNLTSKDSAVQRLRFYTFTGKNYFSMVVGGTNVPLPTLKEADEHGHGDAILDSEGCAEIDGTKYIFLGWTKDKTYHDNWKKIQDGTYIGGIPTLESAAGVTITESVDYYAVWAKKDVTVSYYDETGVDRALGYAQAIDQPAVLIGAETFSRTKDSYRISFWNDSELKDKNWKTDETRKGFKLNGWRLARTEEEGDNPLVSLDFIPLCDVKLYADWSRTHYRAVFCVEENAEKIKDDSNITENASGSWESNIVYFPIGYSGYLPFMNDSSSVSDFKETVSGGIDAYEFTSVPIRENYAIIKWTQNDADSSSYRTINYTDSNGKMLYKQKWTLGNEDVIFTGTWKKITNTITFKPGNKGETALDWENKKLKYTIGSSIGKPEVSNVWEDKDTSDGWEIIGWKNNHGDAITFPYTITENDETWTAEWKKTSSTVTYEFADASKGITGENADGKTNCTKHYKVGENIEILTLEALGTSAPVDSKGTKDGITYYVKGSDNHAYVITGWKDREGNKVSASDKVTEDNCSLTAIWEEVTTKVTVTVTVPPNDIEEWNSNNAKGNGWVEKKAGSDTVWTLTLELNPGEKFADYFTKGSGTLSDKLYGADNPIGTNDLKHFKELSYETVVYAGGNISLSDANAVVPYTAGNHTANVTGIWTQKKILTTFASVVPGADNGGSSSPVVLGYMIYDMGNQEVSLPTADQTLLDSAGGGVGIVKPEGYSLSGWKQSPDAAGEGVVTFVPEIGKHNSTWYAVWKKNESQVTASRLKTENSQNSTRTISRSKWRTFSFPSTDSYEKVAGELYELNDLLTKEEGTTGKTGTDGGFYLTYDQAASFLNCFTVDSAMHLEEVSAIYDSNGTESYNEISFRNMYTTTWELRDIFGYISSRIDNSDLKDMGMLQSGNTIVYDGRLKGELMRAFQFHNENNATGAGYATNVRALFTHSIKTGDITITKKLTSAAASVAKRKGDTEQEFAFKVSFYHIFGDASDTEKRLYTGEYKKLDKYGNYVRNEADQIITYSANDGKIKIKNGETAIITGIPVLTEYEITEVDSERKSGTYLLSGAKEITAKGLAGKEKKYAVSDETVAEVQSYLEKYTDGGGESYSKSLIDNSAVLEGKKLQDLSDSGIDASIHRSFTGKVSTSGYTYNYVATNEVLINGVSLYMDKIIDEFYYSDNDRFTEDITYEELTDAKQTFVFNIRYTAVDDTGSVTGNPVDYQEKLTFDPADSTIEKVNLPSGLQTEEKKKGYKKSGIVIGLEPGYYEVSEDENWSWKYDLMGIYYTPYGNDGSTLNKVYETNEHQKSVADKNKAGTEYPKVYRFYIRGKSDSASGTTIEKGGVSYRILDNVEDPTVTFVNMKAEDGRENIAGDTEIAVNRILLPTPTPNPNEYTGIAIDDAQKNQTLIKAETCILPNVKAEKADGTGAITDISNDNTKLRWSILSGSESVSLTGTTLTANAAGTAKVQAAYLDADGTTEHTATMTITVVEAEVFALKEGSTGQSGSYLVQCKTGCSSSTTNDISNKAIDGNESTMWIANKGTWGEGIYWGLLFKDDAGTGYCNRKISNVKISFEQQNCQRTIVLYGVSGDSLTESTSALTQLGEKTLGANETELEFDIPIGSYKGIKAVMKSCTGTAAPWPAIAEVKITGY